MKRIHWLIGLAVIAVLALAFMLGHGGSTPGAATASQAAPTFKYNFVANDVIARQTGSDGKLQYEIEAERVEQNPDDNQVAAVNLTVHYESPEEKTAATSSNWKLTANNATLPEDGKLLKLRGAVRVTGRPPAASGPVEIATESLDYDTQTQEITTPEIVDMHMGQQHLQGLGLQANIRLGTLRLETQVHGSIAH
ncbi:MAG: LPS export ABC transporter periplasmic protein LptC [Pseudomonadota bacterium]